MDYHPIPNINIPDVRGTPNDRIEREKNERPGRWLSTQDQGQSRGMLTTFHRKKPWIKPSLDHGLYGDLKTSMSLYLGTYRIKTLLRGCPLKINEKADDRLCWQLLNPWWYWLRAERGLGLCTLIKREETLIPFVICVIKSTAQFHQKASKQVSE